MELVRDKVPDPMSTEFHVRRATPADAEIIGTHRARMFHDMGDIPDHLFDEFQARSRDRIREQLTSGEYVGWLASPADSLGKIIGGAGAQLRRVMPHPSTVQMASLESAKDVTPSSSTFLPNPNGADVAVAALLLQHIIDWSRTERLDRLVLHASDEGRALYEKLGFVLTNEMKFVGKK